MQALSLGLIGAGFWARFQAAAWREAPGARLAAICDRDEAKAAALALEFGIPGVFQDAESMLGSGMLDFVDVVTGPETHAALVDLAARARLPVICQKPMALDYATCQRMVAACRDAGVPLLIHENYRWFSVEWYRADNGQSQDGEDVAARDWRELTTPWIGVDVVVRLLRKGA